MTTLNTDPRPDADGPDDARFNRFALPVESVGAFAAMVAIFAAVGMVVAPLVSGSVV